MVRRISTTARHADMLERRAGLPWEVSVPSLRITIWGRMSVGGMWMNGWKGG